MRLLKIPLCCALALAISLPLLDGCGKRPKPQEPQKAEAEAPTKAPAAAAPAPAPAPAPKKPAVVDKEEGSLSARISSDGKSDDDLPKVEVDSSNVLVQSKEVVGDVAYELRDGEKKKPLPSVKAPEGSLALKLETSNVYRWSPLWRFKGAGGVWLPDMRLSPDGSVIGFLETTGRDEGPYGTRVILWNVYQRKTIKVIELPERKLSSFAFVPGSSSIACLSERQTDLKQPSCVVAVDLGEGQISGVSQPLMKPGVSIVCDSRGKAYVTTEGSSSIEIFSMSDLGANPKRFAVSSQGAALSLSSDGSLLVCAGAGPVEFLRVSEAGLSKASSFPLPEGLAEAGSVLMVDKDNEFFIAPKFSPLTEGDLFYVRISDSLTRKPMQGKASGLLAYNPKDGIAFIGLKLRGQIQPCKLPVLEMLPGDATSPGELSPHTASSPCKLEYLKAYDALAALDDNGNFYILKKPPKEKRWQKHLVFSALKAPKG